MKIMVCVLTFIAAVCDIRTQRIPNRLIMTGCLCALGMSLVGWSVRPMKALQGMLLPLVFPGILFIPGMMGAGDIKLLGMIGMFLGPGRVLRVICLSFAAGAVESFAVLLMRRKKRIVFIGFQRLLDFITGSRNRLHAKRYLEHTAAENRICLTPGVLAGLLLQILIFEPH